MKAGSGPKLSSRYAKMPPERGNAPASSAMVSAPNRAMTQPSIQHRMAGPGSWSWAATVAGTRKIPLPIVAPTSTATALTSPTCLGRRSPHRSASPPTPAPPRASVLAPSSVGPDGVFCIKSSGFCCKSVHARRGLGRVFRYYAIASVSLRSIQRKVSSFKHGAGRIRAGVGHCAPDARRYPPVVRAPAGSVDCHDRLSKPLRHLARAGQAHPRQDDEKFLATQATEERRLYDQGPHGAGYPLQDFISGGMSELGVDLLEVIDVDDQAGTGALFRITQ